MSSFSRSRAAVLVAALLGGSAATATGFDLLPQVRWKQLSPEQQERALRNFQKYKDLSPEERGGVDQRYRRWKELPADDKQRLRQSYEKYQELPDEKREEIRNRSRERRKDR